jgi:16S rRNA (cytidine1402-2'-O)-methyltransferase
LSVAAGTARRGRLLVVGTPIGNLGDLTPRAAKALREADAVVAEDTRMAARLLAHLKARTPSTSFTEHNAAARLPGLLARLAAGDTLALTTDAGMPGVSDPGARLVAAARGAGVAVEVIPGPSAVTAAMALAGVEASGFVFGGFLPARPASARSAALARLLAAAGETGLPLILFEAPPRVRSLLTALGKAAPAARVALGRELTKRYEQVLTGSPSGVAAALGEPRGEMTLVVSGVAAPPPPAGHGLDPGRLVSEAVSAGIPSRTTVELLKAAGLTHREAYAAVHPSRGANRSREP